MWATLALMTTLNLAPAQEGLELKNVRATYGILGQERKDNNVLPGDIYFLHFDIEGLQVGKDDIIRYSMGLEFLDKDGKTPPGAAKREPVPQETVNTLGGNRVPALANAVVGLDMPPGEYTVKITVTDLANKKTGTLSRKFEVLPKRFGVVRVGFAYETGQAAPPLGVVGQNLIFQFTAVEIGLDEKNKQPNIAAEITIVDEATGKPTLTQPLQGQVQEVTDEVRKLRVLPMSCPISLNRPGKFKVQLSVTDKVSRKKAEQVLDLQSIEIK
jgi:hypothetical protein